MRKSLLPLILIIVVCLILLLHISFLRFVCDDAFISFRYAKNFVEGHGLVYNIGEKVEGYSNFLWTLLLSLFMKIGLDPVVMSQILGILFSLATIFLLLRLNRRFYPSDNLFNYLAPLFLACCGAYAAWSTGGLETSFFTFLIFLGSFFIIKGMDQPKHFAYSGLTFAFVCMTRLDGLIFVFATFLFLIYLRVIGKRVNLKSIGLWTFFFLAPFLLYFFWRWSYYGKFLPNTFYVKVGGAYYYKQGLVYLLNFLERFWIWFMVIPLLFLGKAIKSNSQLKVMIVYFAWLMLIFSLYVVYVGGDFMDMFRFFVPVLPLFFFLIQEGFRGMYYYSRSLSGRRRRTVIIALKILLVGLGLFLLAYPSRESNKVWSRNNIDSIGLLRESAYLWSKAGLMFKRIAKSGESLSTTAAGAIPYYSELYTIDELGLTLLASQSEFKSRKVEKTGHRKMVTDEFVLSQKPTYVVGHPGIFYEHELSGGVAASPRYKIFVGNGYKAVLLPMRTSEDEVKYLCCLTSKESLAEGSDQRSLQHSRDEEEERK